MKRLLFILITFFSVSAGQAQTSYDTIALMHSYNPDIGMQLKWLPLSFSIFKEGFENGYNLYRTEVKEVNGGERAGEYIKLNGEPLHYWPLSKLEEEIQEDSSLTAAAIFIGGADELINRYVGETGQEAVERAKADEMVHMLGSFAAISNNRVAEALGMYFIDNGYVPGRKYLYKIEVAGAAEETASYALVFPAVDKPKEKVMGFTAELYPGTIHLRWFNNSNRNFPYYNIYRSRKKNGRYTRLNDVPYVGNFGNARFEGNTTAFTDSIPEYGVTYYYKIAGVNAFEEEGTPSDIKEVKAYYMLQNAPVITDSEEEKQNITLYWDIPEQDKPYVEGYSIFRAGSGRGPYHKIHDGHLSSKTFSYVDETPKGASNYYVISAYGESGDSINSVLRSHLLVDSIPPAKPSELSGICDSNGVVTLEWKNNTERDLKGYRIFRTYSLNQEPDRVLEGHTSDTVLYDTLNLKEAYNKIYYRVVALDGHYNPSVPSEFHEVILPDFNPPASGYLKTYSVGMKGINLQWQPSNAYDLKKMYLMRKSEMDFKYEPILEMEGEELERKSYTDTTAESAVVYSYALMAEDEAGLKSELSNVFRIKQRTKRKVNAISNLRAIASRDNKMIKLSWDYPKQAEGFRIYRARNGEQVSTYKFIEGTKREFYDDWLRPNSKYTYQIVAELPGGFHSGLSQKIEVEY